MNRQKSIALFAAIVTVVMTTVSLSGVSASPMMVASLPQSQDSGMGMLGHVEWTLYDPDGYVKQYIQSDNVVVDDGKDCVAVELFGAAGGAGTCNTTGNFNYIGIGNGTTSATNTDTALDGTGTCATGSATGELARKLVTPIIQTGSTAGSGTIVELEVPNAFTFVAGVNASNTIEQSAIFNGDVTSTIGTTGQCNVRGTPDTDWNMFSIQDLNGGSGIAVTDGDSLSVKWTITLGGV